MKKRDKTLLTARRLRAAAEVLQTDGWIQDMAHGVWVESGDELGVPHWTETERRTVGAKHCSIGAFDVVARGRWPITRHLTAAFAIYLGSHALAEGDMDDSDDIVTTWNDNSARTAVEVTGAMIAAAEELERSVEPDTVWVITAERSEVDEPTLVEA